MQRGCLQAGITAQSGAQKLQILFLSAAKALSPQGKKAEKEVNFFVFYPAGQ
jgi:hypothetical protein